MRSSKALDVEGDHYPVPPSKEFVGQWVGYVQMFLFALIFAGDHFFDGAQLPRLAPIDLLCSNKMVSFMMVWLVGNTAQSAFLQTNAFEVYVGDDLVWSSLRKKRLPNFQDLVRGFQKFDITFQ